jgi:hypothetical protein
LLLLYDGVPESTDDESGLLDRDAFLELVQNVGLGPRRCLARAAGPG